MYTGVTTFKKIVRYFGPPSIIDIITAKMYPVIDKLHFHKNFLAAKV